MTYTSRDRDRARRTVTAVTGLGAVGAFTATGWLAGLAAADYSSEQGATKTDTAAGKPAAHLRAQRERGLSQRPYVTRITVRYVPGAARTSAAPAPAGPVSNVASTTSSTSSSSSGPSSSSSGPSDSSGPGSSGAPAAPSSGS